MQTHRIGSNLAVAALLASFVGGCTAVPYTAVEASAPPAEPQAVLRTVALERSVEDRILALNPEQVTEDDVRAVLVKGPTPRIMGVHGGIYPVHLLMESFAQFLTGMGYPEDRIRALGDGTLSRSPYE